MQEREQGSLALDLDPQVVEAALAGGDPIRVDPRDAVRQALEQRASACAKEIGVSHFVLRVAKIKPAQQRIGGQLRGARKIAAAVGLGLREAQQLPGAPVRVDPDPAMQRLEQPVDGGRRAAHGGNAST